ncbi:MAG: hypothetical protein ABI268_03585 [Rhodanobacter sp.]
MPTPAVGQDHLAAGFRHAGETGPGSLTGFALEDDASLRMMRDYGRDMGMGHDAGMIPDMADPKNLFGYMIDKAASKVT